MANISTRGLIVHEGQGGEGQNYLPPLVSLAVLYFMMGFITCLNDTLVPFFKVGFSLTYAQSSLVQFYFFLTYGVMSIPAGKIVGNVGYKRGMVLGFYVAAFGAFLFFPASLYHYYYLFLVALFILAIGIVLLQVAANPYITVLGPSQTASSRLTLIQGIGSIGTTVAPIFGATFILSHIQEPSQSIQGIGVGYTYLGISGLLLLIAVVLSMLNLPPVDVAKTSKTIFSFNGNKRLLSFRNLNFGIWGIFFYVGAEVSIGTFLTNYIADNLDVGEGQANTLVAYYWGCMLVGRLFGAFVLKWLKPAYVLSACAAMAIVMIGTSVSSTGYVAVWTMIAVGLFNSIMFATIFSLAVSDLGEYAAQASGLVSTAIVGGAVISFPLGVLIDNFGWTIAFMLPLLCYIYILFYGIYGYRSKPQRL